MIVFEQSAVFGSSMFQILAALFCSILTFHIKFWTASYFSLKCLKPEVDPYLEQESYMTAFTLDSPPPQMHSFLRNNLLKRSTITLTH